MKALVRSTLLSLCVLQASACSQQIDARSSLVGDSLLQAAKQGDLAGVNALLEDESKVDVRDACHWTPLMQAASHGHIHTAKRLLQAGAATEFADKGSYTALMLAAATWKVHRCCWTLAPIPQQLTFTAAPPPIGLG